MNKIRTYYELVKPGIVRGNLITIIAGYLLGANGTVDAWQLLWLCIGSALVIASSCVVNNIFDRDIDVQMKRTKNRGLVTGNISLRFAVATAIMFGSLGVILLYVFVSRSTAILGLAGHLLYSFVYTYSKRKTHYSTLIGTVPGAIPPVAGYVASHTKLDLTSLYLFLILVCWQMPHFLAIAIRRSKEYSEAKIPLLNLVKGIESAKKQIYFYIIGFISTTLLLGIHEQLGVTYFVIMTFIGGFWLYSAIERPQKTSDEQWAKRVFFVSLMSLLVFDVLIAVSKYIQ